MLESFIRAIQIPASPFIDLVVSGTNRTRALIVCGDEILLLRGWIGSQRWSLSGGGLKKGEKPEEGIIRELREEVGLTVEQGQPLLLGIFEQKLRKITYKASIFHIEFARKPNIRIRKTEIIEAKWFRIDELPNDINPVVKEALEARKK